MSILLPALASTALALTALSSTETIPGDRLERAVALRCPAVDVALYAAITPEGDGIAVNLMGDDLVHSWHITEDGTSGTDRVRMMSVAICNRVERHAAQRHQASSQAVARPASAAGPVELWAFVGADMTFGRPELGGRISRCITGWCPEAAVSVRIRPWSNNTLRDSLPEPRWAFVAGAGRELGQHTRAGLGVLFEASFPRDGNRWGGGVAWFQADVHKNFDARVSFELARTGGMREVWTSPVSSMTDYQTWTRADLVATLLWGRS